MPSKVAISIVGIPNLKKFIQLTLWNKSKDFLNSLNDLQKENIKIKAIHLKVSVIKHEYKSAKYPNLNSTTNIKHNNGLKMSEKVDKIVGRITIWIEQHKELNMQLKL